MATPLLMFPVVLVVNCGMRQKLQDLYQKNVYIPSIEGGHARSHDALPRQPKILPEDYCTVRSCFVRHLLSSGRQAGFAKEVPIGTSRIQRVVSRLLQNTEYPVPGKKVPNTDFKKVQGTTKCKKP